DNERKRWFDLHLPILPRAFPDADDTAWMKVADKDTGAKLITCSGRLKLNAGAAAMPGQKQIVPALGLRQ
ncbi:MAG: hypothetical protein OEW59_01950, partial [Gammaproteobacteria bacterium]|nr:hypothetical protein [Gammaproteobacteria bacterium]